MTFRTHYEESKWSALEAKEDAVLNRAIKGKATPQDYKVLEKIFRDKDSLAASIIGKTIEAVEAAAQKRIEQIEERRAAKGKEPLTEDQFKNLLDKALARAWDDQGPELVVVIEESVQRALREQDERLGKDFEKKLRELVAPREDINLEDIASMIQSNGHNGYYGRILTQRFEELKTLIKSLQISTKQLEDSAELGAWRAFQRYSKQMGPHQPQSTSSGNTPRNHLSGQRNNSQAQSQTQPLQSTHRLEQLVEDAVNNQEETMQRILETLENMKESDSDRRERYDELAEALARKMKLDGNSFGAKAKKAGGVGLLAGLGILAAKLLLSELMGGRVWEELKKMFSSQTMSDFVDQFMQTLNSAGRSIIDYISKSLGDAQKAAEDKAGVKDYDSPALKDAKYKAMYAKSAYEFKRDNGGYSKDEVDAAKKAWDSAQASVDEMQKDQDDSRKAGRGKIPQAPGSPPTPGGSPGSSPPPGTPGGGGSSSPLPTFPGSGGPANYFDPNNGSTAERLGSGTFPTMPSTGSTQVIPRQSTPWTPVVMGQGAQTQFAPNGSQLPRAAQPVGGAVPSLSNLQYRPSTDGTLLLANIDLLGK